MNQTNIPLFVSLTVVLLAGCDNRPSTQAMPEINDTNCQIDVIKKIEDKAARETFAGLCSRRPAGAGIAPTEKPLNWLELADPKEQRGQEVKR